MFILHHLIMYFYFEDISLSKAFLFFYFAGSLLMNQSINPQNADAIVTLSGISNKNA